MIVCFQLEPRPHGTYVINTDAINFWHMLRFLFGSEQTGLWLRLASGLVGEFLYRGGCFGLTVQCMCGVLDKGQMKEKDALELVPATKECLILRLVLHVKGEELCVHVETGLGRIWHGSHLGVVAKGSRSSLRDGSSVSLGSLWF